MNSGVRAKQGAVWHRNGKVLNRTAMARKRRVSSGDATERNGFVGYCSGMVQKRRESQRNREERLCDGKARRGKGDALNCTVMAWHREARELRCIVKALQ